MSQTHLRVWQMLPTLLTRRNSEVLVIRDVFTYHVETHHTKQCTVYRYTITILLQQLASLAAASIWDHHSAQWNWRVMRMKLKPRACKICKSGNRMKLYEITVYEMTLLQPCLRPRTNA